MKCTICHKPVPTVIATQLRKGEKRKVFFCTTCELGILDSHIGATELKKFYSKEYRASEKLTSQGNPEELFSMYSQFQGDRLRLLAPYLTKKARVLEVGCSAGMFLYHAKKKVKEIVGIDFDRASAAYAAKKCGCTVYTTDIAETPLKKGYFDLIVAFQTVEHVQDPAGFVASLKEYLAPGGSIAIEVPNLYDALAYTYNLPFHRDFFFHAAHLWYFTQKSLEKVMRSCGFSGQIFHIQDYNVMNHMQWIVTDRPQSTGVPGLSAPTLPLKKTIPKKVATRLQNFILDMDAAYKKTLADLHLTSNIFFIGKIGKKK
mgnify:CR=1 FL=1